MQIIPCRLHIMLMKWKYICINASSRHVMEVNDQIYAPASLTWYWSSVLCEQEADCAPEPG